MAYKEIYVKPNGGIPDSDIASANKWNNQVAKTYSITITPASWATSGTKFKYTYSNTSLRASVNPIIICTSNEKEYSYIADAEATAKTGIVFTANKKPTTNIVLTIIDIG